MIKHDVSAFINSPHKSLSQLGFYIFFIVFDYNFMANIIIILIFIFIGSPTTPITFNNLFVSRHL